jgi:hypothetical protein
MGVEWFIGVALLEEKRGDGHYGNVPLAEVRIGDVYVVGFLVVLPAP